MDLSDQMGNTKEKSNLQKIIAEDIMTECVSVVHEKTKIGQVAHLMLRAKISSYPIVDDNKKIVGIITLTDLFKLIGQIAHECVDVSNGINETDLSRKLALYKEKDVKEIMSRNIISINPQTTLFEIVDAVIKWNIHSFPVMKNGRLVGIIGRHDVLNAAFVYG